MKQLPNPCVGAVVIGRNEGDRLKRCLASTMAQLDTVVYVDSGSMDGSAEYAETAGTTVVRLDMSIPFNAGRARNEGFHRLMETAPALKFVQFIDGDCELCPGWIDSGQSFLENNSNYAVVTGRVKERHPEASIYNWLCDVEWQGSSGDVRSCGGIFMIKAVAFSGVAGFNVSMIAGEEPEMCYRLRQAGWKIYSLSLQMTLHDAAMKHFSQWWKRTIRGGVAYAHGFYLHWKDKHPHHQIENLRILIWVLFIPSITIISFLIMGISALVLLAFYPIQFFRQYYKALKQFRNHKKAFYFSLSNFVVKFAQFLGQLIFIRRVLLSQKHQIIEYK